MNNKVIKACPACGGSMYVSRLTCGECAIEISGNFGAVEEASPFLALNEEESEFIKLFLRCEGNIKKVQEHSDLGYTAIKTKINEINIKLTKENENNMKDLMTNLPLSGNNLPSDHLKALLNEKGGKAKVVMLRGEDMLIWATNDGIRNASYPALVCEWHIFDAIVDKARALGGVMYRGDSESQKGKKIGTPEFSVDTIDAFISLAFYGNEMGSSTTRRSTYYASILDWAGIATNNRSEGEGGYIRLSSAWNK